MSPADGWKWKWSNGVGKSEMSIIWCISATNNVKSCTNFKETAQTANFTVFTMCGRELFFNIFIHVYSGFKYWDSITKSKYKMFLTKLWSEFQLAIFWLKFQISFFCARVTKFKINWDGSDGGGENSENVPPKRDPNQLSDNSQVGLLVDFVLTSDILSRWTLPWNQPMVCQQQLP